MYRCPRCLKEYGPHPNKPEGFGSDVACAFYRSGSFKADNWNCATMNAIRGAAWRLSLGIGGSRLALNSRTNDISLAVLRDPDDGGSIVLSYYKERGCVPIAHWFRDDEHGLLTERQADRVLSHQCYRDVARPEEE